MQTWIEGTVVETIRWNDELYSVRIDAPVHGFEAGQFTKIGLDIDGERVGRAYSYVNAPDERPIEIHFNTGPEGPLACTSPSGSSRSSPPGSAGSLPPAFSRARA